MNSDLQAISNDLAEIKSKIIYNKRVLSFDEGCKYTGFSRSYMYKLTSGGIIPYSKPNNKIIFFDRDKLDEWLLKNSTKSNEEKEVAASTHISTSILKRKGGSK